MANRQQNLLLLEGKDTWAIWREEHPEIQPDLINANFRDADLYKTLQLHFVGGSVLSSQFGVCFRS